MNKCLVLLFSFFAFSASCQLSQLKVYTSIVDPDTCFRILIQSVDDSAKVHEEEFDSYLNVSLDSLRPGLYRVSIFNQFAQDQAYVIKYVSLFRDKATILNIDLDLTLSYTKFDTISRRLNEKNKAELEITLSFIKTDWINPSSYIKASGSLSFTQYQWLAFSKHVGILFGGGLGYSHHAISNDTSFIYAPEFKKVYENYSYPNANVAFKIRLTPGNQQEAPHEPLKFVIDIGAVYFIPILFKQVVRYEGGKKLNNYALHQFTDLRAFINIGYSYFAFFGEYRLSDFILGHYPELPRYNAGIRFFIPI